MKETIQNMKFRFQSVEEIPNHILGEILDDKKKYPEKVINIVLDEIDKRKMNMQELVVHPNDIDHSEFKFLQWLKKKPMELIFILMVLLSLRISSSIIIIITSYFTIQQIKNNRIGLWKKAYWVFVLMIFGIIIAGLYFKYALAGEPID